jgi:uncharacterized protein
MKKLLLLTTIMVGLSGPANATSFNCNYATQPAEFTICQNQELGAADEMNARMFYRLRDALPPYQREAFNVTERDWMDHRNACANNASCISANYTQNINYLCVFAGESGVELEDCDE